MTKNRITDDTAKKMGERLKQARLRAGFRTAKAFIQAGSFNQPTYSQHESGKRSISYRMAKKYAELLNVHPAWLLTGEEYSDVKVRKKLTSEDIEKIDKHAKNVRQHFINKPDFSMNASVFTEIFCKVYKELSQAPVTNLKMIKAALETTIDIYTNAENASSDPVFQAAIIDASLKSYKKGLANKK